MTDRAEAGIKELLRPMANLIGARLPASCGYALFLFHVHGRGNTIYISNARRPEMLDLVDEHIAFMARAPTADTRDPQALHDDQSFESRAFREALQEPFKRIHRIIRMNGPDGIGYCVIAFEWTDKGLAYISSETREDTLRMIRAWRDYARKQQKATKS